MSRAGALISFTFFLFPSLSLSPLSSIIGSLRSDDGDDNENNKKQ